MKRGASGPDQQLRIRIAQEAGRLMAEGGVRDFALAKRKAAERLGAPTTRNLPTNQEVEEAQREYQRLFRSHTQPQRLRELREAAVQAMRLLERFDPALVGPVLAGTADAHSAVNLHLFSDTPEEVGLFLDERGIPHTLDERRLRVNAEHSDNFPLYRFVAGDVPVELTVFAPNGRRQAPLSPVDGRPMRRANLLAVEELRRE